MPALSPAELKRRRRVAARGLLSGPRGTRVIVDPGWKKHLVDGVWVDRLPFNAGEAWAAQRALEEADRLEIEAAVLASEANEDILLAEPAQSDPERQAWRTITTSRVCTQDEHPPVGSWGSSSRNFWPEDVHLDREMRKLLPICTPALL